MGTLTCWHVLCALCSHCSDFSCPAQLGSHLSASFCYYDLFSGIMPNSCLTKIINYGQNNVSLISFKTSTLQKVWLIKIRLNQYKIYLYIKSAMSNKHSSNKVLFVIFDKIFKLRTIHFSSIKISYVRNNLRILCFLSKIISKQETLHDNKFPNTIGLQCVKSVSVISTLCDHNT